MRVATLAAIMRTAIPKMLWSVVKLVNVALKPSHRKAQKLLAELHNSGEGQPLGEEDSEGIAKSLLLELQHLERRHEERRHDSADNAEAAFCIFRWRGAVEAGEGRGGLS